MNIFLLYFFAAAFLALSLFLIRETSPYSRIGGSAYEMRRVKRVAGIVLFVAATVVSGIGLMSQWALSNH